ncbi:MAG: MlaD family protein [Gammaproteobacteria bacterium]|nr:MlaD family protein [Gammaproteobacteria bacterium]
MLNRCLKAITSLMVIALVAGCGLSSKSIDVSVVFADAEALSPGQVVRFGRNDVGKVKAVERNAEGATVHLRLNEEEAGAVQHNAAAMIVYAEPRRVEIYNPGSTGETITDGDKLYGLNNNLELLAWQAGSAAASVTQSMQQAVTGLQEYFDSEDWERAKQEMQRQLDLLARESNESLERLGRDYETLLKELESQSAEAMEEAQKHFEDFARALEEQLRELNEKGQHDLANALQRLLDILRSSMEQQEYQTI